MKLYLQEYDQKDLLQKLTLLDKYLLEINENTEFYTYQGIFQIDSKNIYKLLIKNDNQRTLNSNNTVFLVDESIIEREISYQIPFHHLVLNYKKFVFCVNKKSKLRYIVECITEQKKNDDMNKNLIKKYDGINISNNYFELYSNNDNDIPCNEINVFLSLLN